MENGTHVEKVVISIYSIHSCVHVGNTNLRIEGRKEPEAQLLVSEWKRGNEIFWRKTITLYKETIGKKPSANLNIKTLYGCNHKLKACKTGGIRETIENRTRYRPPCNGYLEAKAEWLNRTVGR